jgi:hypothetical protein
MDEIRRREQIRRFAEAYVTALGLTGNDATNIQHEIEQTLVAHELLDDAVLVNRVRKMQRDEELRAGGLSQEQIDEVREQLYGTTAYDTCRGSASRFLEMVVQGMTQRVNGRKSSSTMPARMTR